MDHLLLFYPFSVRVGNTIKNILGFATNWQAESINDTWKLWWVWASPKKCKRLPPLINWGIWLSQNNEIFQDKSSSQDRVSAHVIFIFSLLLDSKFVHIPRNIIVEEINRSFPYAYFDAASLLGNECGGIYSLSTRKSLLQPLEWIGQRI